ncbi:MAG: hypothetical protein K0V04_18110 [Deltaproteobacteria bacterium]|nr:hypothetical protein [Deltaproteobacteria bacterium]
MNTTIKPLALLVASVIVACTPDPEDVVADSDPTGGSAGSSTSGGAGPGTGADASDGDGQTETGSADTTMGEPVGPCAGYEGVVTAEQVAMSPRPNEEAEVLAIEASGEAVAPQSLYTRIETDLALLRALDPSIADIILTWGVWPDQLNLFPDEETRAAMVAGTYTAWDCSNAHYQVVETDTTETADNTIVTFNGRFNFDFLLPEYEAMPGIEVAQPAGAPNLDNAMDLCAEVQGDDMFYIFSRPVDIDFDERRGYRVGPDGTATLLGDWSYTGDPEPQWHVERSACSQWFLGFDT